MKRRDVLIGAGAVALAGAGATTVTMTGMGSTTEYAAAVAATRAALTAQPALKDLVRYATLAPSGHNTQPWRFRISENEIAITPDLSRQTPVVDPDDHHVYVSIGAAAETLRLAAMARGFLGDLQFAPDGEGAVRYAFKPGAASPSPLFSAITRRQSMRTVYSGGRVSPDVLNSLRDAAAMPGVDLMVTVDRRKIDAVRDLILAANDAQMADAAFVKELKRWLRFNPRQAIAHGDGLYSVASGNPALPNWAGPTMFDMAFSATSEREKYARQIDSSSGLAIFIGAQADHDHWVRVGRACQRFALQATALGLKLAFVNQPVEVPSFRPQLAAIAGAPERRPDILMRFGYATALPFSPRQAVDSVLA